MQKTWPCSEEAVPSGNIPFTRAGGGVGKQRQREELKAVGSPETCCWGWERCLAEVCLLTTFPFHSHRFFFSFFQGPGHSHWSYEGKYPAVTPAFFSYHPADPGPEPAVVNDYRAPVHTPQLTFLSCLILMLHQCPNLGMDGLKSQGWL